jgi:hypothetical protein
MRPKFLGLTITLTLVSKAAVHFSTATVPPCEQLSMNEDMLVPIATQPRLHNSSTFASSL